MEASLGHEAHRLDPLVRIRALAKSYGPVHALKPCDIDVHRGEVFGLLGPNGSGKTTLIRLLMGYLTPTDGRATIEGLDCHLESVKVHELVSYLPGEVRLFGRMSGREVLRFLCEVHPAGDLQRAVALARRLELELNRKVAYCSTGMRQKLALVATMAAHTPFVILDEPTANLDPSMRTEVLALLKEARGEGRTVLFSSHVLSEAEAACDRVAILRQGELVHLQVMTELRRRHRIRGQLRGPLPDPPAELRGDLEIDVDERGRAVILTAGELSHLFGWLSRVPLVEVRIEPVSLQTVYDRYHVNEEAA